MGCGGHQYGYPTSIKSYYESINILSVMKVQYDELVAGGLVPVATPLGRRKLLAQSDTVALTFTVEATNFSELDTFESLLVTTDPSKVAEIKLKFESAGLQLTAVVCPICLLYTSPSPRDLSTSRMPSSA